MKKLLFFLVFVFCYWFPLMVKASEDDWVYKSKYIVSFPIVKKWKGSVKSEFRFDDDMNHHYYHDIDAGLIYKWLDWLEVSGNYRYIEKQSEGDWKTENRPHLNAKLKLKWQNFELSNNNRLEYRIREDKDDIWRYRNKLKIKYLLRLTKLEISPFISEEIFYDFDANQLNKYRLEGGISIKPIKNLKLDISYQLDRPKEKGDWADVNCLVTYLQFSF